MLRFIVTEYGDIAGINKITGLFSITEYSRCLICNQLLNESADDASFPEAPLSFSVYVGKSEYDIFETEKSVIEFYIFFCSLFGQPVKG